MVDDEILDQFDTFMSPYYEGREYQCSQMAISLKLESLKRTLTDAQRAELRDLLDMMSNDSSRTAMVAFVTGVRNGEHLREKDADHIK